MEEHNIISLISIIFQCIQNITQYNKFDFDNLFSAFKTQNGQFQCEQGRGQLVGVWAKPATGGLFKENYKDIYIINMKYDINMIYYSL